MNKLLWVTAALLAVIIMQTNVEAASIIYGGDAIGEDSTWTDGHGVIAAQIATNFDDPSWIWSNNTGAPAFEYNSNGIAHFSEFRAVTALIRRTSSPANWSEQNWTIDVWEKSSYLSMGAPIITANLGNTPSNWSGFTTLANLDVVPDTASFGVPGGNALPGTVSYELDFNLQGISAFQNPLPEGDYIVSFTSRSAPLNFGDSLVLSSRVGQGPVPYYSETISAIDPGLVIGRLTSSLDFRFGMNLTIESELISGDFSSPAGWDFDDGAGTVDIIQLVDDDVAHFTAGSPAILSQSVITESDNLDLSFDFMFSGPSGSFDVLLGSDLLASFDGSSYVPGEWNAFDLFSTDATFSDRMDDLTFIYNGPTGSEFFVDDVSLNGSSIPEPTGFALIAIGFLSICHRQRRCREKEIACNV